MNKLISNKLCFGFKLSLVEQKRGRKGLLADQMITISISVPALSLLNLDINECRSLAVLEMADFMEVQMIRSDIH